MVWMKASWEQFLLGMPGLEQHWVVLNHAYVMRDVYDIRLNGESIGEIGLNALWAAYLKSALIMVVGDDYAAQEAQDF